MTIAWYVSDVVETSKVRDIPFLAIIASQTSAFGRYTGCYPEDNGQRHISAFLGIGMIMEWLSRAVGCGTLQIIMYLTSISPSHVKIHDSFKCYDGPILGMGTILPACRSTLSSVTEQLHPCTSHMQRMAPSAKQMCFSHTNRICV